MAEEEGSHLEKIKLSITTWNVGNAIPFDDPDDLHSVCPAKGETFDVIVIGVQECHYNKRKGSKALAAAAEGGEGNDDEDQDDQDQDQNEERLEKSHTAKKIEMDSKSPEDSDLEMEMQARHQKMNDHFDQEVMSHARQQNYVLAKKIHLVEMRLLVLVHKRCPFNPKLIASDKEATGIGHVYGNKGGLCVKIEIEGTSLCFISCHLAAHIQHWKHRNRDLEEIFDGIHVGTTASEKLSDGHESLDVTQQFHHVFVFGDLNYRIDINDPGETDNDKKVRYKSGSDAHKKHWQKIQDLIKDGNLEELWKNDQLKNNIDDCNILCGFSEGVKPGSPYNFAPTFKVEREKGTTYKQQRASSWCDRILWHSLPGYEGDITPLEYTSLPDVGTSDHKPIRAGFEVALNKPYPTHKKKGASLWTVKFEYVKGTNLEAMDKKIGSKTAGSSDPYVKIYTVPDLPKALGKKVVLPCRKKQLSPKWEADEIDRVVVNLISGEEEFLKNTNLVIALFDNDAMSSDDPMGTVMINLGDVQNSENMTKTFEKQELRVNTTVRKGTLDFKCQLVPPEEADGPKGSKCVVS